MRPVSGTSVGRVMRLTFGSDNRQLLFWLLLTSSDLVEAVDLWGKATYKTHDNRWNMSRDSSNG